MITDSDGYSCFQDVNANRIIIGLPQTWKTLNNTTTAITTRKLMLTSGEEAALLAVVRAMFEKTKGESE